MENINLKIKEVVREMNFKSKMILEDMVEKQKNEINQKIVEIISK